MNSSSATRARALKARRSEAGMVQCNVWVPAEHADDFKRAALLIREDPSRRLGIVRQQSPNNSAPHRGDENKAK